MARRAPAMLAAAVAAGQTQMGTAQVDSLWPLHEAKKLRILAVGRPAATNRASSFRHYWSWATEISRWTP